MTAELVMQLDARARVLARAALEVERERATHPRRRHANRAAEARRRAEMGGTDREPGVRGAGLSHP